MTQTVATVSCGFMVKVMDDAPASVADDDLAPTGQSSTKRQSGFFPNLLQTNKLLQEQEEQAQIAGLELVQFLQSLHAHYRRYRPVVTHDDLLMAVFGSFH